MDKKKDSDSIYALRCSVRGPVLGNHQFKRVLAYCFRHHKSSPVFYMDTITATFHGLREGGNLKQFLRRNFGVHLSKKKGSVETGQIALSVERTNAAISG